MWLVLVNLFVSPIELIVRIGFFYNLVLKLNPIVFIYRWSAGRLIHQTRNIVDDLCHGFCASDGDAIDVESWFFLSGLLKVRNDFLLAI